MNRGKVLQVQKDYIIVLTPSAEYIKIKKKNNIGVGKEIFFMKDDLYKENNFYIKPMLKIAVIAMLLLISTVFFSPIAPINTTVAAVISIDINPSIEFQIDENMNIIKVIPLNEEGMLLIDDSLNKKNITDGIQFIICKAKELDYLSNNQKAIMVSTAIINKASNLDANTIENSMKIVLEKDSVNDDINIAYILCQAENYKAAKDNQISVGKYEIYNQLKQNSENVTVTLDDVKKMSVNEMQSKNMIQFRFQNKAQDDEKEKQRNQNSVQNRFKIMDIYGGNNNQIQSRNNNIQDNKDADIQDNKDVDIQNNNESNNQDNTEDNGYQNANQQCNQYQNNDTTEQINEVQDEQNKHQKKKGK